MGAIVTIKGDKGEQGVSGINGSDGLSAYEVWLSQGNTGSIQDYLDSLQGQQGIPGQDGGTEVSTDAGNTAILGSDGFTYVPLPNADQVDDSSTNNKFVSQAEKNTIANQSGTNTGDETTSTIQSKRPLKTVDGESLDGLGNISVGVTLISGDGVDNTNPELPVVSFPNQSEVQSIRPLKTVNGETLEGSGDIPFPSGGNGDMLKSVYDVNDDGIVDKAQSVIFKAELNQNVVKGNLVYGVNRNPTTGNPIVGLADNTVTFADKPVGMALSSGNAGAIIDLVKIGVIEGIDTSLFNVGETVYLSTFGNFDKKSNITTGVFSPIGYVVLSGFSNGAIIVDTSSNETINTDNSINQSNVPGRTVTEALNNLNNAGGLPLYKSVQANISRPNQTTIPLANQQQNIFEEYFEDSFTPSVTDNFQVSIRWKWSSDVTQASSIFRVTFSDGTNPDIVLISRIEPKDAGGGGEIVNILTGGVITGNVNTGTSERLLGVEVADVILNQGVTYNLKLEWTNENVNTDTTIYSSTIRWEQKTQNF